MLASKGTALSHSGNDIGKAPLKAPKAKHP
jgi:hypothetical protein